MTWRIAGPDDAVALREFEREANLIGLAHVFPAADGRLRHLGVRPDRWGSGLAREAVARSVVAIRATGRVPLLWVLDANDRARGLYEHLGWEPTGREQRAEWPPYPTEVEYRLPESGHER